MAEATLTSASLLISCFGDDTGGGLFTFSEGRLRVLDRLASGGITASDDLLRRILPQRTSEGVKCRILTYSEGALSSSPVLPGIVDPHDILDDAGNLLVVSTGTNEIACVDQFGKVVTHWRATGCGNSWHLNCLTRIDGRLVISAFGVFERDGDWRDHKMDGSGVLHDICSGQDLVTGLCCPHHPRQIGNELVVCNSAEHELLAYDLATLCLVRQIGLGGWTRGLAFDEKNLFVGVSSPRDYPANSSLAWVAILDRISWNIKGTIKLPCREIYDVLVVPLREGSAPKWLYQRTALA